MARKSYDLLTLMPIKPCPGGCGRTVRGSPRLRSPPWDLCFFCMQKFRAAGLLDLWEFREVLSGRRIQEARLR
jgi:hypothetical protein